MRILLVANFVPDQQESMQRFCEMLRSGLVERGNEVEVVRPTPCFVRLVAGPQALRKWLGYIDKFLLFPFVLSTRLRACDVVHICDHSNSMYTRLLRDKPHVVTCHDLMAVRSALGEIPENPTGWSGRILQGTILRGLRRARLVACVSQQTRRDLLRLTGRVDSVTPWVPNGLNYEYRPMEEAGARKRVESILGREPAPFFLHVGGNQWYKNRAGVLKIFAALREREEFSRYRMVMVGKPFPDEMRSLAARSGLNESLIEVVSLPNEDLRALYSLAEALIFPSIEEGFGWPIVEAQACGCPVFTTNRAPMNEIGGDAARYFDPADPIAAAREIADGLGQRSGMKRQGLENSRRFTTDAMLEAYERLYSQCVATSG